MLSHSTRGGGGGGPGGGPGGGAGGNYVNKQLGNICIWQLIIDLWRPFEAKSLSVNELTEIRMVVNFYDSISSSDPDGKLTD